MAERNVRRVFSTHFSMASRPNLVIMPCVEKTLRTFRSAVDIMGVDVVDKDTQRLGYFGPKSTERIHSTWVNMGSRMIRHNHDHCGEPFQTIIKSFQGEHATTKWSKVSRGNMQLRNAWCRCRKSPDYHVVMHYKIVHFVVACSPWSILSTTNSGLNFGGKFLRWIFVQIGVSCRRLC